MKLWYWITGFYLGDFGVVVFLGFFSQVFICVKNGLTQTSCRLFYQHLLQSSSEPSARTGRKWRHWCSESSTETTESRAGNSHGAGKGRREKQEFLPALPVYRVSSSNLKMNFSLEMHRTEWTSRDPWRAGLHLVCQDMVLTLASSSCLFLGRWG